MRFQTLRGSRRLSLTLGLMFVGSVVTSAAQAAGAITLSPTSLAFGSQTVGLVSASKSVVLKNSGTSSISLSSVALSGSEEGNFALKNDCAKSLAAGATCTLLVTFKPVSTGALSASISIVDNAEGSPQSVLLTGNGLKLTASPTFSPAAGDYATPHLVTISDSTAGAIIHYTIDGSTPTTSSPHYSGAICVKSTETIKALAVATGDTQSEVSSAVYTISANKGAVTTLHSFLGNPIDGQYPVAGVVMASDGNLYGTTTEGGAYGAYNYDSGTVFKVSLCGVETVLHSFGSGSDANVPEAGLLPDGHGSFYGTSYNGGTGVTGGYGTVFKITSTGTLTLIHSFPDAFVGKNLDDGLGPAAGLIADSDGNLYGTTTYSVDGVGSVFKISAAGAEKVIYNFRGTPDGVHPTASLSIGKDGNLWGTTPGGGEFNDGTVFKVTPGGIETVVYSFKNAPDGINPNGLILASDGNFYGTTPSGGQYGRGTIFKVTPTGIETVIHSFGKGTDGFTPQAALIQGTDGNLYGTTAGGGTYASYGTVFKATLAGKETVIFNFPGSYQGIPYGEQSAAPLFEDTEGSLYGTTRFGGASGLGTVFKISNIVPR